ncbi:hypothetical protein DFP73DRAFT_628270 [Morchella snyderi]|nr:hypothetical protein DFP73DRAFT_628270 [Morchella snyderi]
MRAFSLLLPVLSLLSATANAITTHTHTLTLHQWPLGAPHPTILGKVSYDSATGEGGFGVAEHSGAWAESGEEEEVRVGVWNGETWLFGCVVVGKTLKHPENADITVRVDDTGKAWHVQYKAGDEASSSPTVRILTQAPGPQPVLNKPIVLTPDGKIPVPEVEKTFLQKYWWVLLGATLLIMTSGGGAE